MEIKINREVLTYRETIFVGLSARQFFCSLGAVASAVGVLEKEALMPPQADRRKFRLITREMIKRVFVFFIPNDP